MNLKLCVHRAKLCAETAAQKSHFVYLAAATALDGHIVLRVASGGCFVLCLMGSLLKDGEEVA